MKKEPHHFRECYLEVVPEYIDHSERITGFTRSVWWDLLCCVFENVILPALKSATQICSKRLDNLSEMNC